MGSALADRVFLDTNVFLYAADELAPRKRDRARELIGALSAEARIVVSTQILQEFYANATGKLRIPPEKAQERVRSMARLEVVEIRPDHILGAIDLHRLHAISFWDALVVRCASVAGCSRVLTEDLQDRHSIDGVRIENPFRDLPSGP
jgi:predicted nucleic acid-binding protein